MAYDLLGFAFLLAFIVFVVNKFSFSTDVVLYGIAISIAIIPEGLIAVITIVQALGVR